MRKNEATRLRAVPCWKSHSAKKPHELTIKADCVTVRSTEQLEERFLIRGHAERGEQVCTTHVGAEQVPALNHRRTEPSTDTACPWSDPSNIGSAKMVGLLRRHPIPIIDIFVRNALRDAVLRMGEFAQARGRCELTTPWVLELRGIARAWSAPGLIFSS